LSIKNKLCAYISEELLEDDDPIDANDNLLADGMVDSMGMLRLVAHIDEKWNIRVPPDDFTIENFKTIAAIEAYLTSRLESSDE